MWKEKIMRNKKVLGIIAAIVVVMGIASAVVVSYLSNTTVANVEVKSPFEIQQDIGSGYSVNPVTLTSSFGGSTEVVNYRVINNANNGISAVLTMTISEETAIGCSDLSSITIPWDVTPFSCLTLNATTVEYKSNPIAFGAGSSNDATASFTFNAGALGNYTILTQMTVN